MKGRLGSLTIKLFFLNVSAFIAVLVLAYYAGANSPQAAVYDVGTMTSRSGFQVIWAGLLALLVPVVSFLFILSNRILKPLHEVTEFSEKLAGGEFRTRLQLDSADDFGLITDNLNRAADRVTRTVFSNE